MCTHLELRQKLWWKQGIPIPITDIFKKLAKYGLYWASTLPLWQRSGSALELHVFSSDNYLDVMVVSHICFIDKINLLLIFLSLKPVLGLLFSKHDFPWLREHVVLHLPFFWEGITSWRYLIQVFVLFFLCKNGTINMLSMYSGK